MTKWKTVRLTYADWVRLANDKPYMQRQVDWLQRRQNETCFQNWYLTMGKDHVKRNVIEHRWILSWNKPDRLPGHDYEWS